MESRVCCTSKAITTFPILIQQISVAKIGDPGAPAFNQVSKRSCIWAEFQAGIYQVTPTFQRCAVVRSPKEHNLTELPPPVVASHLAIMASTAGDQASHAV